MSDFNFDFSLGALVRPSIGALTSYTQGGGVAPAFDPLTLFAAGEQGVWYDPSDFSTMWQDSARTTPVTAVGQVVGALNDKSGRGNHATQATSAARPLLQVDGSGKYFLQFDGVDDFLVTGSVDFTATDKMTTIFGSLTTTSAVNQGVIDLGATNNGTFNSIYMVGTSGFLQSQLINGGAASAIYTNLTGLNAPTVFSQAYDFAGAAVNDEIKQRVNGTFPTQAVQQPGPVAGMFGNYALSLGVRTGQLLQGNIYGVIIRGALTSGAALTDAENYINSKTGAFI